jgi:uncharacterized protein (DUF2147 family)
MQPASRTTRHAASIAKRLLLVVAALIANHVFAQATPIGLWRVIDDDTHQATSLVRISEAGGTITGKVERLLDPAMQDARCDKCTDERKDKPVVGMTIIRNVRQDAEDKEVWTGGEILDPNNGKTYKTRLKPVEGGKHLQMRGYIGPFYRTQTWVRVE